MTSATLANLLSASRIFMAPGLGWCVLTGNWWSACLLFLLAVSTDIADGRIARGSDASSAFGGLLDHSSDALFVTVGLLALALSGYLPLLLPLLVVVSFSQYVFDSRALAGRQLRASWLGRANGIAYYVLLGFALFWHALFPENVIQSLLILLGWALVTTTVLSMSDRAWTLLNAGRRE